MTNITPILMWLIKSDYCGYCENSIKNKTAAKKRAEITGKGKRKK